jgi:hypothetical protein
MNRGMRLSKLHQRKLRLLDNDLAAFRFATSEVRVLLLEQDEVSALRRAIKLALSVEFIAGAAKFSKKLQAKIGASGGPR